MQNPLQAQQPMSLTPQNMNEAMQMSEMLAQSEIVPKDFRGKPGNVLVAIQWGLEVGLPPLQSLQNIAVINGRPSMYGDSVIALVQGSGKLEYIKETNENGVATCIVRRKGGTEHISTFSEDDAKKAGLLGKAGPWTQYPKRMMQMRARSFALRDVFADVLKGIAVAEEVQDIPEDTAQNLHVKADDPKQLTQKDTPLYQQVGDMLLDHVQGDVAMMKDFVIETLELPESTKFAGKWMQKLEDEELTKLKSRINELNQTKFSEE